MPPLDELAEVITQDSVFRAKLAQQSHFWFYHIYLSRHLHHPTAEFQKILLLAVSDSPPSTIVAMAFPCSSKSLIASMSLPLWGILNGRYREVWIIGDNKKAAKVMIERIQDELDCNQILKQDFELRSNNRNNRIIFPKLSAMIRSFNLEDNLQLIFNGPRPDLIVIDNPKDYGQCLKILNLKDANTRLIVVGRGEGKKGAMNKLCNLVNQKKIDDAIALSYPFFQTDSKPFWSEKFFTRIRINDELEKIDDDIKRYYYEYLLWHEASDILPALYRAKRTGKQSSNTKYSSLTFSFGSDKENLIIILGVKTLKALTFHRVVYDGKCDHSFGIQKAVQEALIKSAKPNTIVELFVPDEELGNQIKKIFSQFTIKLCSSISLDQQKRFFGLCDRLGEQQISVGLELVRYIVEKNIDREDIGIVNALMCCGRGQEKFTDNDPKEIQESGIRVIFNNGYKFQEIHTANTKK